MEEQTKGYRNRSASGQYKTLIAAISAIYSGKLPRKWCISAGFGAGMIVDGLLSKSNDGGGRVGEAKTHVIGARELFEYALLMQAVAKNAHAAHAAEAGK